MGRRQVVRHRVLVPAFGGSNPSVPAKIISIAKRSPNLGFFLFSAFLRPLEKVWNGFESLFSYIKEPVAKIELRK